jgi:excisionase family DNA binding protein
MTFYKIADIARILHVSRDTVRGWIGSGALSAINVGSQKPRYRVSQEELDRFVASKTVVPVEGARRRSRVTKTFF